MSEETINVPKPQFYQYQFVTVHIEGQSYKTKVVRRYLDLDSRNCDWWYQLQGIKNPNERTGWFTSWFIEPGH